jgi:hypothetical protein
MYMWLAQKRNIILVLSAGLLILLASWTISWGFYVEHAHSTFENYYAFRGCQQLLTKTNSDATCRLPSGQVIKLVQVQNKWYLDGDLPVCYFSDKICL